MSKTYTVETDTNLLGQTRTDDAGEDIRNITETDTETGEEKTYHTETRTNWLGQTVTDDADQPIIDIKPND